LLLLSSFAALARLRLNGSAGRGFGLGRLNGLRGFAALIAELFGATATVLRKEKRDPRPGGRGSLVAFPG
jgi:hypothetical protein